MMNLFIPGMLAKDIAESLKNLNSVLEKGLQYRRLYQNN
jgi:hypothetical protein